MALTRLNNRALASDSQFTADQLDVGQLGGRRNLIINGGFDVWQRGTSGTNGYTADRFTTANATSINKVTSTLSGFGAAARIVTIAGDTVFAQQIENTNGRFAGQTLTLSFWMKTDTAYPFDAGQYCEWYDAADAYQILVVGVPTVIETNGEWKRYARTFTLPAGAVGHKFNARIDFNQSIAQTLDITGVQLELGSVATPFEHRSYGEELALCQRYYYKPADKMWFFDIGGGDYRRLTVPFPSTMRATPTATYTISGAYSTSGVQYMCSTHTGVYVNGATSNNELIDAQFDAEL